MGLLVIKGFDNMRQLEHYRSIMAQKGLELPPTVRPIMISKPNFELLLREGRSFEEYFNFEDAAAVEAKEEEVLEGSEDQSEDSSGEVESAMEEVPEEEPAVEKPAVEEPSAEESAEESPDSPTVP